jgi:ribonuclease R
MPKSERTIEAKARGKVLKILRKRSQRPLHASEVRGRAGFERTEHAEVLKLLEQLVEQGEIAKLPGERYQAHRQSPASKPEAVADAAERVTRPSDGRKLAGLKRELEGILTVNARGFGFVATEGDGPDVFIPPGYLGGGMQGDRVLVRARSGPKGLEGRVVEALDRAVSFVGGQIHLGDQPWLEPDDERLQMPIRIEGELPAEARTGLGAIARVVGYPAREGDALQVRIVETFEPEAFVQYEVRRILLREGISETFPPEVEAEAQALLHAVSPRDRRSREDLRAIPLLTIDPADARDHDDAVWAEPLAQGGFRVLVAIADVSHYVPEGSALDVEAVARGCTIYLPTRAIPMLPAELSSGLASLLPKRDRLTLAVEIELDRNGEPVEHRFIEGVMRSAACLTYESVAQALGLTVHGPNLPEAQEHLAELTVLLDVAKVLRERRRARGSLEFELPEAKVRLDDETGHPIDIERSRKDPGVARAYGMIEELMLLANEVVAADLTQRGLPTIYRVHGAPDPDRLDAFCALGKALGFELDADVAQQPKKLARFLTSIQGTPHASALGYLLLRAMQQASYDIENVGHFGLAAEHYVHFTSPIRRYPDLAVHRIVRAVARGERIEIRGLPARLRQQAAAASVRERKSMAIEREVVDLYGAYLLRNQVGERCHHQ